jgi:hypothetical protein
VQAAIVPVVNAIEKSSTANKSSESGVTSKSLNLI